MNKITINLIVIITFFSVIFTQEPNNKNIFDIQKYEVYEINNNNDDEYSENIKQNPYDTEENNIFFDEIIEDFEDGKNIEGLIFTLKNSNELSIFNNKRKKELNIKNNSEFNESLVSKKITEFFIQTKEVNFKATAIIKEQNVEEQNKEAEIYELKLFNPNIKYNPLKKLFIQLSALSSVENIDSLNVNSLSSVEKISNSSKKILGNHLEGNKTILLFFKNLTSDEINNPHNLSKEFLNPSDKLIFFNFRKTILNYST